MATLQWNVTKGGDTPPVVTAPEGATMNSVSAQLSDADMDRVIAAYRTIPEYARIQTGVDENDQPMIRDTTDAEVELLIIRGVLNSMLLNATRIEQAQAAQQAADNVPVIEAVPITEAGPVVARAVKK